MISYTCINVQTLPEYIEVLQAFFSEYPFDSFLDEEDGFKAYIPNQELTEEVREFLHDLRERYPFSFTEEPMKNINWNSEWENNYSPIEVGNYIRIRAEFHEVKSGFSHELVITPKMAFGTGHHETTWMMMDQMQKLDWSGKSVFDFGAGTGILAMVAALEGSTDIDAVDNEHPAFLSISENSERNGVGEWIKPFYGTLEVVPEREYDVILANINRNVILESVPSLVNRLKPNGKILVSGILIEDESIITSAFEAKGLNKKDLQNRGKWICLVFEKN
jgi:ribosomal protein L11 methyltransferase